MAARRAKGQSTHDLLEAAVATRDSAATRMWTRVLEEVSPFVSGTNVGIGGEGEGAYS